LIGDVASPLSQCPLSRKGIPVVPNVPREFPCNRSATAPGFVNVFVGPYFELQL
jgi:hypothetical protein